MSRTTALAVVPDRRPAELAEFRNAHGWAPSIWSRLFAHRGFEGGYFRHGDAELERLWHDIENLPEWQQIPLVLTFDTGVIPGEEAKAAADLLDEFERRLPEHPNRANHVPAMADLLRTQQPEAPIIGVWGTSVSDNPFDPWDEEADAPGSGIPASDMYALPQHRDILDRITP